MATTEQPKYTLLETLTTNGKETIEIRQYEPMILAVTHTSRGNGFQQLAGYIFGGNESNKSITC